MAFCHGASCLISFISAFLEIDLNGIHVGHLVVLADTKG